MIGIRLITSFGLAGSSFGSLDGVCDRLRRALKGHHVDNIRVYPDEDRVHVEFTVEASGFNDANVRSGRILLQSLNETGIEVGDPEDIDRVATLDELNDANENRLLDQSRRLRFA